MSKRDALDQRGSREQSACAPALPGVGPGTPAWVPASVSYTQIPEKFRAMIAEIIEPAYEQLVVEKILAKGERGALFRRQGAVVATWRKRDGRTLGPYYRLMYRQRGRRHSIYLGRSAALAREVRTLLDSLQRTAREDREWERLRRAVKEALRARKAEWGQELAKHGFWLKGYEVRRCKGGHLAQRGRLACGSASLD